MKKIMKIFMTVLAVMLICFTFAACGGSELPDQGTPGTGDDNTLRDNDFLDDPDRRPDRLPFVDNTPSEEEGAVLAAYGFEFENAKMSGNSTNKDHRCIANSFEFNAGFGGGICLKNTPSGTTFTFTFESDKAVRSPMIITLANNYCKGDSLSSAYGITNNGNPVVDTSVIVPSEGQAPSGATAGYFTMTEVETMVSIAKGKNRLAFTAAGAGMNIDSFRIETSAVLVDNTEGNWLDEGVGVADVFTVSTAPTIKSGGKIKYTCPNETCGTVTEKNLPALDSSFYDISDLDDGTEYTIKLLGETFSVAKLAEKRYTLTLQDGAQFSDGTTSGKVLEGAVPDISFVQPGKKLTGWKDVVDQTTYEIGFAMPQKDLTLAPVYETLTEKTLTLEGATFGDGTTVKKVMPYEELTMNFTVPEGKTMIGWYNVSDRAEVYAGESFVMPNEDITISPLFDIAEYAPTDGSKDGKLQLYPKASSSSWRKDKVTKGYLESVVLGAVGDECGSVYHIVGGTATEAVEGAKLEKGFYGMTQNPYKITANTVYTATVTVQNNGSDALELQFYATGSSGTPRPAGSGSEEVTLAPNETKTISFEFTFTADNNNIMFVFDLLNDTPIDEMNIGMYVYVAKKV